MTNYNIFVAMPFGTKKANNKRYFIDFDAIYNKAIKPAADELRIPIIRADEENDSGIIHTLMIERLVCTDIVIVDITNENPNVYYELGIRHCARPCTTILIYDKSTRPPFDIQPLRAIPYELEKGVISDSSAEALKNNLVNRIKGVINSEYKCDSLPFALIDDFPKTELDETKLQIYQEHQKQRTNFLDQLRNAKTLDELIGIISEMDSKDFPYQYLIFELIKRFKSFEAWDDLIHFIDNKLNSALKNLLYVKQQKALAYNKKGDFSDIQTSIVLLQEILREHGDSSETYGLIGSAYKKLAILDKTSVGFKPNLERAILNYREGFKFDTRDYYTGINLATLLLVKGSEDSLAEMNEIIPILKYNLELNDYSISADYWLLATAYELYILSKNYDKAKEVLGWISTLQPLPDKWTLKSTLKNLNLIKETYQKEGLPTDWYENFVSLLNNKKEI